MALFNGEIYNYEELRKEVVAEGEQLGTRSESELLCCLYRKHGASFVSRLRGMFAIVLHDGRDNTLVAARDYIGKKPLYFMTVGDGVALASELTPLLRLQPARQVSIAALSRYFLTNAAGSGGESLISGIRKIAPAEIVIWQPSGERRRCYWHASVNAAPMSIDSCAEALETLLRRAVRRRLFTDNVPLGILLSGGLDSSLVAAIAMREGVSLECFTAGFDGRSYDESDDAAETARALGLRHNRVHLSDTTLASLALRFVGRLDEPLADPSLLAVLAVTEASAQSAYKGMLTGDGADDLFLGYPFFIAAGILRRAERFCPRSVQKILASAFAALPSSARNMDPVHVAAMLMRGLGKPESLRYAYTTSAFTPGELRNILSGDAREAVALSPAASEAPPGVRTTQLGMIDTFLQGPILTKLDRGGMLNGVELRSPFLDQDVADFSFRCPTDALLNGKTTKAVVRKVASAYLPRSVMVRKKRGFRLPVARLLRGPLCEWARDVLASNRLRNAGLFDPARITRLMDEHRAGRDRSKQIWSVLCFQTWLDKLARVPANAF